MPQTGLVAEGLAAFRGERLVFAGVGFAVPRGGALVLEGPNGAGKSTLLRVLAGLGRAEAGTVRWDGQDVGAERPGHVAYLGHQDAVKPGLGVAENLAFWGERAAVIAALERVGLRRLAELPARMLSAGQRRRLALARFALTTAPLWLLDEPTLGLDAGAVAGLGEMLAVHRAAGGVVVAATHLTLPLPGAGVLGMTRSEQEWGVAPNPTRGQAPGPY